ncbi:hypothetical protein MNBD_GAMMA17-833 [hydrothermal vent metagenome]|uniref:Uncharacterized protein n=1 Tax=hydrothermal vent metagenome TaxID=652676 RepID=A0A3B0ZE85_9ZZZZ
MVLQAHRSAEALTRIAIECLDKEHYSEAKGVLKQARRLKDDPFISTLYGFAKALS